MKTTVEELKSYYVAQGGTEADVADITTIPDMIAAITALGGGGGGGDTARFDINVTNNTPALVDATVDDVVQAAKDGKTVVIAIHEPFDLGDGRIVDTINFGTVEVNTMYSTFAVTSFVKMSGESPSMLVYSVTSTLDKQLEYAQKYITLSDHA